MVRGSSCGSGSVVVPHVLVREVCVAAARRRVAQRVAVTALASYAAVARARAPALPAEHSAAAVVWCRSVGCHFGHGTRATETT